MVKNKKNPALPVGSWVYRNWKAKREGAEEFFAEELPLYSDARFTGEIYDDFRPYAVLNTIPDPHDPGTVVPAAVLRVGAHLDEGTDYIVAAFRAGVPDAEAFTGGTTYEEITSLFALAYRVRLAVGGATRWFYPGNADPRGSPRHPGNTIPILLPGRRRNVIPDLARTVSLTNDLIPTYPDLEWETAKELARAARSYRNALWVVDSDPNLAWLFLVSAVETAANEWARLNNDPKLSNAELLRAVKPDFAERLVQKAESAADAVLDEVGATQALVLRAQWKFREFLLKYGMSPPRRRPKAFPIDWEPKTMKKVLEMVYRYRSEALHASKTFPLPMSEPPFPSEDDRGERAWSEKPGGGSFQSGALWTEDQLPINIYAFHHMVAEALQGWWRDIGIENRRVHSTG